MSEALATTSPMPSGWYDDPGSPDKQRWWTGSEWTHHVRYSDKLRPMAIAPAPETAPVVLPVSEESPLAYVPPPPAPEVVAEGFDDFYVPMRHFEPGASASYAAMPRARKMAAGVLWLLALPVIGIAVGVALWVLLPR
jgi:hypothetical protein